MMEFFATGMMSGTSLDGMDLAHCRFVLKNGRWSYRILAAETIPYPNAWKNELAGAPALNGRALQTLHMRYGKFAGEMAHDFFRRHGIRQTELLASHGHTVFHDPDRGYTFQLGHGASMAAAAKCTVVNDFRSMDVALGGQGAPLVPLGDQVLFGDHQYCLNLGGFANISFDAEDKRRVAYDICPLNFVINRLVINSRIPAAVNDPKLHDPSAEPEYLIQDTNGAIARAGKTHPDLLQKLNSLSFYHRKGPKSLGEEWVNRHIMPLLKAYPIPLKDLLHTFYRHAATQIGKQMGTAPAKLLVTGGGTHNHFFMECLRKSLPSAIETVVPEKEIIDFKEALVFAFLGLRCFRKEINCLSSVTGASVDSSGGSLHYFTR